jgi:hypothetical protein
VTPREAFPRGTAKRALAKLGHGRSRGLSKEGPRKASAEAEHEVCLNSYIEAARQQGSKTASRHPEVRATTSKILPTRDLEVINSVKLSLAHSTSSP